jgi:3-deoxy-D-manno-octulosonic-acid transferase
MKFLEHLKTPEDRTFWRLRLNGIEKFYELRKPCIVFNEASLGELNGAMPVARVLRELGFSGTIVLSVGTPTAYRRAKSLDSSGLQLIPIPAPLENPRSISSFIKFIQPDLFVNFEAEYWPMLFAGLRANKVPTILVNGRISKKAFLFYRLFYKVFSPIFRQFVRLGMISRIHCERAVKLGANPKAVLVTGSSKYDDLMVRRHQKNNLLKWRQLFQIDTRFPVIVAGNLRGRECLFAVNTIKKLTEDFPDILAVLAPRHLHRVSEIARETLGSGMKYCLLSDLISGRIPSARDFTVIIVDSFGLLFELYGVADITFCGGTFEPIGGHNIVEPAVWGKKVLYGPFVHKIEREHEVLQKWGIGILCETPDDLARRLRNELASGDRHKLTLPQNVTEGALKELSGASRIYASWVMEIVDWATT